MELLAKGTSERKLATFLGVSHAGVKFVLRRYPDLVRRASLPKPRVMVATPQTTLAGELAVRSDWPTSDEPFKPVAGVCPKCGRLPDPGYEARGKAEKAVARTLEEAERGKRWGLVLAAAATLNRIADGQVNAQRAGQQMMVYLDQRKVVAGGDSAGELDKLLRATLKKAREMVDAGTVSEEAYSVVLALLAEITGSQATGERHDESELATRA